MLAVCPECKRTITVDSPGWVNCKFCQRRIWIADPQDPHQLPPQDKVIQDPVFPDEGTSTEVPWEDESGGHFVVRFFKTLYRILFDTRRFFTRMPGTPLNARTHSFGIFIVTLGLIQFFQLSAMNVAAMKELLNNEEFLSSTEKLFPFNVQESFQQAIDILNQLKVDDTFFFISTALSPLFALAILWITNRIFITVYILSQRKLPPPRNRIARLAAYVFAPWILMFNPILPIFLGVFWAMITQFFALTKGLRIKSGFAVLTVLFTVFLLYSGFEFWIHIHAALLR